MLPRLFVFSLFLTGPSHAVKREFNWCGEDKVIALTFDDGPLIDGSTENILNDLQLLNLKATFFLSPRGYGYSTSEENEQQCALVDRMVADGHDVQSHSLSHHNMTTLTDEEFGAQLDKFDEWLTNCLNETDVPALHTLFRPPFGEITNHTEDIVQKKNKTVVMWTVNSYDWTGGSVDSILGKITEEFKSVPPNGSAIILFHDHAYYEGRSKGILSLITEHFKEYRFVTILECLQILNQLEPEAEYSNVPELDSNAATSSFANPCHWFILFTCLSSLAVTSIRQE